MTTNSMFLASVADQLNCAAKAADDFWGMFIAQAALSGIFQC